MLDIKFIRENKELVDMAAKKKRLKFDVAELLKVDDERRELLSSIEKRRAEQNDFNVAVVKVADARDRADLIAKMKVVKDSLASEEEKLKGTMKNWQKLMLETPNIPDISVPEGESDADNREYKVWGKIPEFSFKPKSHIELMQLNDMVDFDKGAEVAGFRGYFLKNDGAKLSFALWHFVTEHFSAKKDFSLMLVPSLVKKETLLGTGYLPQGAEDLYKTQDDDYLAGTAEVATMSYFAGTSFPKSELPKKVLAFSPCFRREAGSHGKDTKGIMRVHEFYKFEQVVICEANHLESVKHHEELLANSEELMQALEIPYHIVLNCAADLGLGQVKKYDIEAWVPSEKKYRETHSCSYFHDFQTRRLDIKYKESDGKSKFAHSLNNTALATPRVLISMIENNQREDGSIAIPRVLQKYFGKDEISRE